MAGCETGRVLVRMTSIWAELTSSYEFSRLAVIKPGEVGWVATVEYHGARIWRRKHCRLAELREVTRSWGYPEARMEAGHQPDRA